MAITVGEVIEKLSHFDPDLPLLISQDAEGNEYSGVDVIDEVFVEPDWTGGRTEDVRGIDDIDDLEAEELGLLQRAVAVWRV